MVTTGPAVRRGLARIRARQISPHPLPASRVNVLPANPHPGGVVSVLVPTQRSLGARMGPPRQSRGGEQPADRYPFHPASVFCLAFGPGILNPPVLRGQGNVLGAALETVSHNYTG